MQQNYQELTQDQINVFYQAKKGIIPNEQYQFDPKLQDKHGKTIEDYLLEKKKEVPEYWRIQEDYNNPKLYKYNKTKAMIMAEQGRIPYKEYQHKSEIQNKYGQTVAIYLSQNGIIPPQDWEHKPELKDMYGNTVAIYLIRNNIEIPNQWKQSSKNNQHIQNITKQNDNQQKDENKQTEAMKLAMQGIIPEDKYQHNPELRDKDGHTVCYYLWEQGIIVPENWQDNQYKNPEKDRHKKTKAMQQAFYDKQIPDKKYYHNPSITDNSGWTVAMYLSFNGKEIPQQWYHDPNMVEQTNGDTVAIHLATNGIVPLQEWYHDPTIKNRYGNTVEDYLLQKKKEIPKEWRIQDNYNNPQENRYGQSKAIMMAEQGRLPYKQYQHDPNIKDKNNHTVCYYLKQNNIPVPNEWYDESMKDILKHPEFVQQALYGIIPKKPKDISPDYDCGNEWTVAMLLAYSGKDIPEEWEHDKMICNYKGETVQTLLRQNNLNVPDEWKYDNSDNKTMAMIQAQQGKIPDKQYQHNPELQDKYGKTVAMYLSQLGIIPNQQWQHDVELKDNYNHTVCYYLWNKGMEVPERWQDNQYKNPQKDYNGDTKAMHQAYIEKKIPDKKYYYNPNITNGYGLTVAMDLASNGIIPSKQWEHKPDLQEKNGFTVALLLAFNKIIPPSQWNHNPSIQGYNGFTVAMTLAFKSIIPPKQWHHDPNITNNDGQTVAIILAISGIIPPEEWQHNKYLRSYYGANVQTMLELKYVQVPEYWQYTHEYDVIGTPAIQQAKDGQIPDKENYHEPWISTYEGETVAFWLIRNGIEVTDEWKYNPEYKFALGQTTAMKLVNNSIIPPKQWIHDPNIKDKYGHTVADYFKEKHLPIPNEWYDDSMKNEEKNLEFIEQAIYGQIPIKPDNINSDYQNYKGWTVAMILARLGKDIPKEWIHDKHIRNNNGQTVQMILHEQNIPIPKEWQYPSTFYDDDNSPAMIQAMKGEIPDKENYHDPRQTNKNGDTVAMILMKKNIEVPKEWLYEPEYILSNGINKFTTAIKLSSEGVVPDGYWIYDIDIKDDNGNSIRNNLFRYNYIYQNNQFILNVQTEIKQETCSICLNDSKQEFIKTKCGHNICLECFKELVKQKKQNNFPNCPNCPECRQEDWIIPIDEEQYQRYVLYCKVCYEVLYEFTIVQQVIQNLRRNQ